MRFELKDSVSSGSGVTLDSIMRLTTSTITAESGIVFTGDGSGLTDVNASNLGSGTVPDARFPATLPAVSGANLTNVDATTLDSIDSGSFLSSMLTTP